VKALDIYCGPKALAHIRNYGLQASDIKVIPAAAGGPKGLILGPIDRFLFGDWLSASNHTIDLIGASIGAWRMASACMKDPVASSFKLEDDYIHQDYGYDAQMKRPSAAFVSQQFQATIQAFFGGRERDVIQNTRLRLSVVAAQGLKILAKDTRVRTPLGYGLAYACNFLNRRWLGLWLKRTLLSAQRPGAGGVGEELSLPFNWRADGLTSRQLALTPDNLINAVQASCSIPFVMQSVKGLDGNAQSTYWDGGITDYHLHWNYNSMSNGLVLYPHFQRSLVPGWLDKHLRFRHASTSQLDNVIVLAPKPSWVNQLPNQKIPDRQDFVVFADDQQRRIKSWQTAVSMSQELADELANWLLKPDPSILQAL
jgi:hypothetical protein